MRLLINRYLEGKATREEMARLLDWLRQDGHREEFRQVSSEWKESRKGSPVAPEHLESWERLSSRLLETSGRADKLRIKIRRTFRYAAILILAIALPFLYFTLRTPQTEVGMTCQVISSGPGEITHVTLPDQSEIWLNSESTLRYNNGFSVDNRDLELEGEAFIQAAKNELIPLVVSCSGLMVTVVGTRFNIYSYPGEEEIRVILEEGAVRLTMEGMEDEEVSLEPGQMAIYGRTSRSICIEKVNPLHFTAWKEEGLNFYNQTLEEMVPELERRYGQKFEIDPSARSLKYTLSIRNETLPQVLDLISRINPVDPVWSNDIIYLKFNQEKALQINKAR